MCGGSKMRSELYDTKRARYTKAGYLSYQQAKILELISAGKTEFAEKIILEVLEYYPDDYRISKILADIYRGRGEYHESIKILEGMDEECVIHNLAAFYIKINEKEKLYHLYQKYYSMDLVQKGFGIIDQESNLFSIQLYLKCLFHSNFQIDRNNLCYFDRQIYSYSDREAIKHIRNRHQRYDDKVVFDSNLNIEELFEKVKNHIEINKNLGVLDYPVCDMYHFFYPRCGKVDGEYDTNYFRVITLVNTSNIITMHPVPFNKRMNPLSLEDVRKNEESVKSYVKTRSGLERFNARYNQK